MIATALKLQEVTKNAVFDEVTQHSAGELIIGFGEMGFEEFCEALYKYTTLICALATTLAAEALMTEKEVNELIATIAEMEKMGIDIQENID